MAMTNVGERLKRARDEKALSQRDVARAAGISQSTYSDLERGDGAGRSLEILGQVAKGLGVSADYLLGIEEEARPKRGKGKGLSALTVMERELLGLLRELRPKARRTVLHIVRDLHEEEQSTLQDLALLEQIEEVDKHGLFAKSQARLFQLAAELGSMRAAFAALKDETVTSLAEEAEAKEKGNAGMTKSTNMTR